LKWDQERDYFKKEHKWNEILFGTGRMTPEKRGIRKKEKKSKLSQAFGHERSEEGNEKKKESTIGQEKRAFEKTYQDEGTALKREERDN